MPFNKYGLSKLSWLTVVPSLINPGTFDVLEDRSAGSKFLASQVTAVARDLSREAAEQYVEAHS